MPRTENEALPQVRDNKEVDEDSVTNGVNIKALIHKVNKLHDLIKAGLILSDNELKKILEGLSVNGKEESEVQKLHRVIANLHDDSRHQKEAMKSMQWQLNEVSHHIVKQASQHDLCRKGRAGNFALKRSKSETGPRIRKWKSEDDFESTIRADTSPQPETQPSVSVVGFDYLKSLENMLKVYGHIERPQMAMLLGKWRSKSGIRHRSTSALLEKTTHFFQKRLASLQELVGSVDDASELVIKAREFLAKPMEELMGLTTTKVHNIVIDSIPEDEWLLFARSELEMSESEIADVKGHATPTDEQLRQMDVVQDAWNLAHAAE